MTELSWFLLLNHITISIDNISIEGFLVMDHVVCNEIMLYQLYSTRYFRAELIDYKWVRSTSNYCCEPFFKFKFRLCE